MNELTVEKLFEDNQNRLKLKILNNKSSFQKKIKEKEVHRPGLALSGFVDVFTFKRVQVIGNTELAYLETLTLTKREASLRKVFEFDIPCIFITHNNQPLEELISIANEKEITIFQSSFSTTHVIQILSSYLEKEFAPTKTLHGSLVDVHGVGVLITGRSGIGKSEVALDLVERGHRLVADDVIHLKRQTEGILIGTCSEALLHHMEIRGIGIIDVCSLFGVHAVRFQKRVEIEIHLEDWEEGKNYDRTGLEEHFVNYLDVAIPIINLPIFPGKNITVLAEVIALNHLLKVYGQYTAREFNENLKEKIKTSQTLKDYLFYDTE
jgi:HPr kinase/phosphorylase